MSLALAQYEIGEHGTFPVDVWLGRVGHLSFSAP